MDPKIWGSKAWFFFHSIALTYPEVPTQQDKENYKIFFSILQYVLPCSTCANNYKNHLKSFPLTHEVLSSRKTLFYWSVEMHNKVNKMKDRKTITPEYALKKLSSEYKTRIIL